MADINIEHFYHHIAKIFTILYSNFPSKTALYVDEVAGVDQPDEYGLHSPKYTSGFFAILWLEEEGYLRYTDNIRQDGVDQACLTHKAFLKLTDVSDPIYEETDEVDLRLVTSEGEELSPSVKEEQSLIINQLRRALKKKSSIAVNKIVRHLLIS